MRNGQTPAHARALLAGRGGVVTHQPARDARALDALAQWAMQFAPRAEVDPCCAAGEGGLLLDITGCQRLFGSERNILRKVLAATGRLGLEARAAAAGTIGCAWAMSRYGEHRSACVASGREQAALGPLPVAALRVDPPTAAALAEVGLRTVGQVLAIPPAALRQRFGEELLTRIDQALGRRWEAVVPVDLRIAPRATLELAGPVRSSEAIQLGVRNLLKELLGLRQLGIRRLELTLRRSDLDPLVLTIPLACASADERHLWTLLRPALERANMGFGVEGLELVAADTAALEQTQMPLLPEVLPRHDARRARRALGELVDVLSSRLGPQAVLVRGVDSHVPEHSFTCQPATETLGGRVGTARRNSSARNTGGMDRPSILLDRAEPIEITCLSLDGPVVSVRWNGRTRAVRNCLGPERIAPQWWTRSGGADGEQAATRDYFKLQDELGQWLWVYRRLTDNQWFLHGLWE